MALHSIMAFPSFVLFKLLFFSVFVHLLSNVGTSSTVGGSEDLISARCQSKCLYELEQRHKSNAETRRLLRHQMSTLCKDDIFCASCILPCRESLYEYDLCSHTLCRDTPDPTHCRESCVFLEQIASKKSGHCPPQKPLVPVSECSAFCDVDSDCAEIDKCCVVGCSRSCLTPSLNDSRLLPRPEGITVNERKRKRSAILRWVMKRLSPQHTATNSNLFVIQWRWSVHKLSETMAPWQTIMVRNKMYAILKHLLSPGRFYVFRVAAVNMHGTHGFSQPSHPSFKLSTELKAPSAPLNVTFIYESWRPPKIVWNPPNSEVSLKEYRLSWWRTSDELAKAFELRQRRHSNQKNTADDDYEGLLGEEIDGDEFGLKRSIVLPSYSTKAELAGLEPGHFYIAELYASVESSEGDLRGDPAVLLIRMPNKTEATKMPDPFNDDAETVQNKMNSSASKQLQVEVKTPYFEDGRLKTIISWLSHPKCRPNGGHRRENTAKFRVSIYSLRCFVELPPQQFYVQNCVATLENLQFSCEYSVGVEDADNKRIFESLTFSTLPCEQTPTNAPPLKCGGIVSSGTSSNGTPTAEAQRLEARRHLINDEKRETAIIKTTTELSSNLRTETDEEWLPIGQLEAAENGKAESDKNAQNGGKLKTKQQTVQNELPKSAEDVAEHRLNCFAISVESAVCAWTWPADEQQEQRRHNSLIGFRSVLASTLPGSPSNVSILSAEQRRAQLTGLNPKAVYRFRLQAVTTLGLGAELVEHFSTGGHLAAGNAKMLAADMDHNFEQPELLEKDVHVGHFAHTAEFPWDSSARKESFCIVFVACWTVSLLRLFVLVGGRWNFLFF